MVITIIFAIVSFASFVAVSVIQNSKHLPTAFALSSSLGIFSFAVLPIATAVTGLFIVSAIMLSVTVISTVSSRLIG